MANNTRRPGANHSPLTAALIAGSITGVTRKGECWCSEGTDPETGETRRRYFSERSFGVEDSHRRATRWHLGEATLGPRDGIPNSVSPVRKLSLTRRRLKGKKCVRFEIAIQASKSERTFAWMTKYVGTEATIDQERIDAAVATLEARWDAYHRELWRGRRVASEKALRVTRGPTPGRRRLVLEDVLEWTGVGERVSYFSNVDL